LQQRRLSWARSLGNYWSTTTTTTDDYTDFDGLDSKNRDDCGDAADDDARDDDGDGTDDRHHQQQLHWHSLNIPLFICGEG
jgi:hypothetical protein